ncbi:hypothetical protein BG004_003645 [Podila humilis]|nr:hypothetical protein BG004_003645 [Podila humilis]
MSRLVDALVALCRSNSTLSTVENIAARVYTHVFAMLQLCDQSLGQRLRSSLMVVDMLLSAGHIANIQIGHLQSNPVSFRVPGCSVVFELLIPHLLDPMWRVLEMIPSHPNLTQLMKHQLVTECEFVLLAVTTAFLNAAKQYGGAFSAEAMALFAILTIFL